MKYSFSLRFCLVLSIALSLVLLSACSRTPAPKRYPLQGRVVAVDAGNRQLTIAHHDVPGLMKGMTMPFLVGKKDEWVFRAIAPGDDIQATLVMSVEPHLEDISFSKTGAIVGDVTSQVHIPQPGEEVPDLTLTNQNGTIIHFKQFDQKPLLLTFIYTRCPFPNYCVRMSHNFAEVLQQLQKNPKAFAEAKLLSISIDPEHDKPDALRSYGAHYVGSVDPNFQHWQFASGTPEQVRKAANFFGLSYNVKDGQIVHGLQTVLVKDGKVLKVYSGNTWKPDEVAAEIANAVLRG